MRQKTREFSIFLYPYFADFYFKSLSTLGRIAVNHKLTVAVQILSNDKPPLFRFWAETAFFYFGTLFAYILAGACEFRQEPEKLARMVANIVLTC